MPEDVGKCDRAGWRLVDLGRIDYPEALDLQHRTVDAFTAHRMDTDGVVLLLEHPPVFTLGRRGGQDNLCVSREQLRSAGIRLVHAERGGDITYHGPGQLVAYPIVRLTSTGKGVADFVTALEEAMIRTAGEWGIPAVRNSANRGVWVGPCKLGSIGIAVRKGITFHGLAMNVNTDLTPFGYIHPCGLHGVAMTSFEKELGGPVSMAKARRQLAGHLERVFGIRLVREDPARFLEMQGD